MSDAPDYDSYLSAKVQHEVEQLRAVNAVLLAALKQVQAAAHDSRVDRSELVSIQRIASAAIAQAEAAGIEEEARK